MYAFVHSIHALMCKLHGHSHMVCKWLCIYASASCSKLLTV